LLPKWTWRISARIKRHATTSLHDHESGTADGRCISHSLWACCMKIWWKFMKSLYYFLLFFVGYELRRNHLMVVEMYYQWVLDCEQVPPFCGFRFLGVQEERRNSWQHITNTPLFFALVNSLLCVNMHGDYKINFQVWKLFTYIL
jgi:hypothetical protein